MLPVRRSQLIDARDSAGRTPKPLSKDEQLMRQAAPRKGIPARICRARPTPPAPRPSRHRTGQDYYLVIMEGHF
jgi:hypothetical protein